jgi:hypothetical protein
MAIPQVAQLYGVAVEGSNAFSVKKGKTPVLNGDEARRLIDSTDVSTIVGLRDRALIALLYTFIHSFARISAAPSGSSGFHL